MFKIHIVNPEKIRNIHIVNASDSQCESDEKWLFRIHNMNFSDSHCEYWKNTKHSHCESLKQIYSSDSQCESEKKNCFLGFTVWMIQIHIVNPENIRSIHIVNPENNVNVTDSHCESWKKLYTVQIHSVNPTKKLFFRIHNMNVSDSHCESWKHTKHSHCESWK